MGSRRRLEPTSGRSGGTAADAADRATARPPGLDAAAPGRRGRTRRSLWAGGVTALGVLACGPAAARLAWGNSWAPWPAAAPQARWTWWVVGGDAAERRQQMQALPRPPAWFSPDYLPALARAAEIGAARRAAFVAVDGDPCALPALWEMGYLDAAGIWSLSILAAEGALAPGPLPTPAPSPADSAAARRAQTLATTAAAVCAEARRRPNATMQITEVAGGGLLAALFNIEAALLHRRRVVYHAIDPTYPRPAAQRYRLRGGAVDPAAGHGGRALDMGDGGGDGGVALHPTAVVNRAHQVAALLATLAPLTAAGQAADGIDLHLHRSVRDYLEHVPQHDREHLLLSRGAGLPQRSAVARADLLIGHDRRGLFALWLPRRGRPAAQHDLLRLPAPAPALLRLRRTLSPPVETVLAGLAEDVGVVPLRRALARTVTAPRWYVDLVGGFEALVQAAPDGARPWAVLDDGAQPVGPDAARLRQARRQRADDLLRAPRPAAVFF